MKTRVGTAPARSEWDRSVGLAARLVGWCDVDWSGAVLAAEPCRLLARPRWRAVCSRWTGFDAVRLEIVPYAVSLTVTSWATIGTAAAPTMTPLTAIPKRRRLGGRVLSDDETSSVESDEVVLSSTSLGAPPPVLSARPARDRGAARAADLPLAMRPRAISAS